MSPAVEELTVASADGTPIGYRRLGAGPAIVFVHGSISTGEQWLPVAELLASDFTCYLMDRRGRGLSGDAQDYSLSTEAADITAVLAAAGAGAALLGHSYGAICALQAMVEGATVPSLILYEPPLPVGGPVSGANLPIYADLVSRGDLDGALSFAMSDLLHVPAADVEGLRSTPLWPQMRDLTPTWTRELEAIDALPADVDRYAAVGTPTLMLLGTRTAQHHIDATRALEKVLSDPRVVEFPGMDHFAHLAATADVAKTIREFLQRDGQ